MRTCGPVCVVVLWLSVAAVSFAQTDSAGPQSPLDPQAALELFQLHPDCRIELVAAEPDVIDPVHIAFDADGRMWVVEYSDYPNGPSDGEPGLSRIRVLTDDDGDGRFENPQIFADKLIFANGLMHWRDGVLVTMDGELVFMRDTDGDGRADERETWFSGFKRDNPQLRANHPTFAIDNHIYVANGLRGGDVVATRLEWSEGAKPVSLSGRDFRFDPLTGAYEAVSGSGQFGITFDDWGQRFLCSNRNPCDHVVLESWDLQLNPRLGVPSVVQQVSPAGEASRIFPISRFWTTSNLHMGQFTAACGVCLYRGNALPPEFAGNSFVCDPTGNLVHRDVLTPHDATFTSHYGRDGVEFLATTDGWCRPVNLTVGPDGALYVVDMYRAVIEHPQFMPTELKERPDLTLGTDRGRIYRIVAKNAPPASSPAPEMNEMTSAELIALLSHPNAWQRETAHRLLLERGDASIAADLRTTLTSADSPAARVHALHLIDGFDKLDRPTVLAAINDGHPRVQSAAVRLAARRFPTDDAMRDALLEVLESAGDERLKFDLVLALGALPASPNIDQEFARLMAAGDSGPWLQTAVALATERPDLILSEVIASGAADPSVIARFSELVGQGGDTERLKTVVRQLGQLSPENAFVALAGLGSGLTRTGQSLARLAAAADDDEVSGMLRGLWSRASAEVEQQPDSNRRLLAIDVLEFAEWEQARVLTEVAGSNDEQPVRLRAIAALRRHRPSEFATALVDQYASATPAIRRAILTTLSASTEGGAAVLDAVETGRISPREFDAAQSNSLQRHRDAAIRERAQRLLTIEVPADRERVLAEYRTALTLDADPRRGVKVFKKQCMQCHRIGTIGVDVAPDISDSRTKTPDDLLTAILDPNRAIDNNYFSFTIVDNDGLVHTGVISSETATAVTLRQPEGKQVTVLRNNIEELTSNGVSLMPVGLEKNIPVQDMADVISFIKNWRYLDGLVPKEVIR